jgi:hypothetical protein
MDDADRNGMMDRSRISPLLLLVPLLAATPALAENQAICNDLHGRIANIPEVITTTHPARKYSAALDQQTYEIRQIQAEMQQRRCSGGSIVNGEDAAACDQLETAFERGQQNMRQLTELQGRSQRNGGSNDILRDQLEAALRDNGCDNTNSAASDTTIITNRREPDATPEQQAMRTDTFIQPLDKSGGPQLGYQDQQSAPLSYPSGGTYGANLQTVCVRTCDGGFFPLTTNASPVNFQQDAATCSRMCPGVPTELYFRYLPNQESSEMVSAATGAPYSAMPYAFAYRKRAPGEKSSCTCNMSAYYEEMRRQKTSTLPQPDAGRSSITSITTPKPQSQQQPAAAPQQATVQPQAPQQPADRPYDPGSSKVRQVGPQFLATDQGKLDLKHPLTSGPQPEQ